MLFWYGFVFGTNRELIEFVEILSDGLAEVLDLYGKYLFLIG